jgi:hypothetical protein
MFWLGLFNVYVWGVSRAAYVRAVVNNVPVIKRSLSKYQQEQEQAQTKLELHQLACQGDMKRAVNSSFLLQPTNPVAGAVEEPKVAGLDLTGAMQRQVQELETKKERLAKEVGELEKRKEDLENDLLLTHKKLGALRQQKEEEEFEVNEV